MRGEYVFILAIGAAFLLLATVAFLSRRAIFKDRKYLPLRDMYDQSPICGQIEYQRFENVMRLIGKCYRVSPEKLRLEDRFSGRLSQYDSWMLDGGLEDLERRLREKYSFELFSGEPIITISDLFKQFANTQAKIESQF